MVSRRTPGHFRFSPSAELGQPITWRSQEKIGDLPISIFIGVRGLALFCGVQELIELVNNSARQEDQLWPEQSTSAIVLHHPQARYFNV